MSDRIDPMEGILNSVPGRILRKFLEDDAPNWAALIAWNALFAMLPIVLFAASLLGYALRLFGKANDQVYKLTFSAIPGDAHTQSQLLDAVSRIKAQSGILFIVGLVGVLWGGSALFGVMEQAFGHTPCIDVKSQESTQAVISAALDPNRQTCAQVWSPQSRKRASEAAY